MVRLGRTPWRLSLIVWSGFLVCDIACCETPTRLRGYVVGQGWVLSHSA